MSGPIDPIAVLDSQIAELRASGDTGNVENLVEARDAFARLRMAADRIKSIGAVCEAFGVRDIRIVSADGTAMSVRMPASDFVALTDAVIRCGSQP